MKMTLPERETMEIEFKSDVKKLSDSDLVDAVVAFANTNGGSLYLGIEDNGSVTGLNEQHKDITQLAAYIANRTVPPVSVKAEILGSEPPVLLIQVPKSRSIVAASNGKIQRRRLKADGTPENVPMYPYEISTRLSELSLLDFSAQPVPGAKYTDIDSLERERLRKIILAYNGEKNLLELSDEELDKALQFVVTTADQLVPTYTGLLLLGKAEKIREYMPTAESAFIMMRGTDVTTNESFFLPLLAAIEKITDFISARNTSEEMEMGMFRISIPEFDPRAVREAVVNAFVHRDYTQLGRVLVKLDADGLSVSNPGGFIEGVTYQNILTVEPHGRNPVLADALKRIGLAERSGRGVDRIFEGSLLYGRDVPDYSESTSRTVKLFIPRGVPDKRLVALISEEQKRTGSPLPLNSLLVLNVLKNNHRMSLADMSHECAIPESKLKTTLERLTESGLIDAMGSGRGRAYVLSAKAYKDPIQHVRQTDIDAVRYKELVITLARRKEYITRRDVIELLHVSPSQAYRLLKKLVEEGLLTLDGTTSAAKYTLKK
ncbi:RNA-binding domain-containing protein [Pseudoflavonifractor sp. MSJ-30]|uniref:RNA-binding domain-containing protein n=1 Tax=Pseudoflavonifractor sp. MSJ-30 TaxID=2841525 RepID=UPI00209F56F0|nr:RNA-binding domain-containing protein [Pseudoflavonifractor sp. MSJ-30]